MSNLETIRRYQAERMAERQAELDTAQKEMDEYLNSEQYERDKWEKYEDYWEAKARKEGWTYTRKPFVSALQRQAANDLKTREEIAHLEEKIRMLKGEL